MAPRKYRPTQIGKFSVRRPGPQIDDPNSMFPKDIPGIVRSATNQSLETYIEKGRSTVEQDRLLTSGSPSETIVGPTWIDGDSNMAGAGTFGSPDHLDPLKYDGIRYYLNITKKYDTSAGGRRLVDIDDEFATNHTAAVAANGGLTPKYFIFNGGHNDMFPAPISGLIPRTVDECLASIVSIFGKANFVGYTHVIYLGLLPFEQAPKPSGGTAYWNIDRQRQVDRLHGEVSLWLSTALTKYRYIDIYGSVLATNNDDTAYKEQIDRKFNVYASALETTYEIPQETVDNVPGIHLTTAGAQKVCSTVNSVLAVIDAGGAGAADRYPVKGLAAINQALAGYTALSAQERNTILTSAYKLGVRGVWDSIVDIYAWRLNATDRDKGLKKRAAAGTTFYQGTPVHTPKDGYALVTNVSTLNTNLNMQMLSDYFNVGWTAFGYIDNLVDATPGTQALFGARAIDGSGGFTFVRGKASGAITAGSEGPTATVSITGPVSLAQMNNVLHSVSRIGLYADNTLVTTRGYIGSAVGSNAAPLHDVQATGNSGTATGEPTADLFAFGATFQQAGFYAGSITATGSLFGFANGNPDLRLIKRTMDTLEAGLAV